MLADPAHFRSTTLAATASHLVGGGNGILAIDESVATCTKRFEALGIDSTPETRRTYRELLLTADGLSEYVGGAILFDETLRQATTEGVPLPAYMTDNGMLPGIKVDAGAKALAGHPGELVTKDSTG